MGISAIGLCFGSFMGVFPGFTADQFGTKNNSVNYGIMFIGFALAGFFGPSIMSKIYSNTQNYQNTFLVAMVLAIVGIMLTISYRIISARIVVKEKY
jgi:MFS family permease